MRLLEDLREILPLLRPQSSIVLHSGCAEPRYLASQLADHAAALREVRLYTMMPMGNSPYAAAPAESLPIVTFFPGRGLRKAATSGRAEVARIALSRISKLFRDGGAKADVLMLQLSPPDENGRMSLGVSVDYMPAVLEQRPMVVAEINPLMPRTCGDTIVREDQIDYIVQSRCPPQAISPTEPDAADRRIADHVANLISHGAVIQTGIGSLPELVLGRLGSLRDLGVHSGIITDALMPLLEKGVVTNATKKQFRGKCVTTMAAGSQEFYEALHQNPAIEFHPCSLTHDVSVIAAIDGFCAINSVLQIDLAGRANAERVDGKIVSAPGGLPDFTQGATMAKGGKSIIALRATANGGSRSNILPELSADAPVTATKDHIDYVVTEHGVARLRGLDSISRAKALIAIADPAFRAELNKHMMQ
jgi:4-hydroxybutyrate CoA-transferase